MIAPPERERYVASSEDLSAAPELAIVDVLDYALVTARAALIAAQPEMISEDVFSEDPPTTPDAWIAENAIAQIDALETTLRLYRRAVTARYCWLLTRRPSP